MFSLSTPYSGSLLAKLVPLVSLTEFANNSFIIKKLEKDSEVNKKIISIIPEYDNHV